MLENKLSLSKDIKTDYRDLTIPEARTIGKGLSSALIVALSGDAGVDEWMMKYPALVELDKTYSWFSPMFRVIGRRLVSLVPWGTKFRVYTGAFISIFDTISDLWVASQYIDEGKPLYAVFVFSCIGVSMLLQSYFVYIQNKRVGLWKLGMEMVPVVFGAKSILDAYRVSSSAKPDRSMRFDYMQELAFSRCSEGEAEGAKRPRIPTWWNGKTNTGFKMSNSSCSLRRVRPQPNLPDLHPPLLLLPHPPNIFLNNFLLPLSLLRPLRLKLRPRRRPKKPSHKPTPIRLHPQHLLQKTGDIPLNVRVKH